MDHSKAAKHLRRSILGRWSGWIDATESDHMRLPLR
jgi:hypothetical protein